MKGLIKKTKPHFEGMKDPRTQCPALRHSYAGMLAMIAVAMMFAANGPTAVVRFWNDIAGHEPRQRHGLLRALGLEKLPSHDALGRVMAATDPDALDQAVQAGRRLVERRRHIAIDGKAWRGSASRANGVEAALVVNAVDVDTKRVLATVATPGPGQEVPTARKLLRRQDICFDGAMGSFDAAHCCRETLDLVRRRGGDWLVPVKGKTPTLRDEIMFSLDAAAAKPITVCEKGTAASTPVPSGWSRLRTHVNGSATTTAAKDCGRADTSSTLPRRGAKSPSVRNARSSARGGWMRGTCWPRRAGTGASRWRTTAWTCRWARTPAASALDGSRHPSLSCAASPWTGSTRGGARTSRCPASSPVCSAASL